MNYCKKCVQPDTRPGIYFNEDGICGACLYEEEKKTIDWSSREKELKEIADWAKQKAKENNSTYECVIGVSGGKDSTFQAIYARDKLGLRTLLVNGEPDGITEIGRKNIENLKNLGFDCISLRPNPKVMQKLVKKDFYEFGNPIKVTEFALWASAYIIADKFNVPLIIQGENPAQTLGVSHIMEKNGDALNVLKQNTLSTGWERYMSEDVTKDDLFMFKFDLESIRKKDTRAVWLGYYAKEWLQTGNARFAIERGLATRPEYFNPYDVGTYAAAYSLDSDMTPVNQMIKHVKFGFGHTTDVACCDIREGEKKKEDVIDLVKKYDGKCSPQLIKNFCDYINISVEEFWRVVETFRGNMWEKKDGGWALKNPIWEQ